MVGYHIADHGLTAEDELFALRHVMADFKRTVSRARGHGRLGVGGGGGGGGGGPGRIEEGGQVGLLEEGRMGWEEGYAIGGKETAEA